MQNEKSFLWIVGLGPALKGFLLPDAALALEKSQNWVGYRYYMELAGKLHDKPVADKGLYVYSLGEELERCKKAIELAQKGEDTALISSGDAGIYAMASPVFELLEKQPAWESCFNLRLVPGISAAHMLACRVGAPLGHDHCSISLSDLMTPWVHIEKKVALAGAADFVIALYNPVSKRRRRLDLVRTMLLETRPSTTPVAYGERLGTALEKVHIGTLEDMKNESANMHTVILIGNSQTRCLGQWIYTPRGYADSNQNDRCS